MPSRIYYRRQADLCLQIALVQNDPQTTLLLAGLAKELQAKADDPDTASTRPVGTLAGLDGMEAESVTLPDRPRRRRGPENPRA
jgi:hypothetical protein